MYFWFRNGINKLTEFEIMINDELTYKIIGCAMKVHKSLGPGFQEVINQRYLEIEFQKSNIEYSREQEHTIFYDWIDVGTRRADFVAGNKVVVEIKALTKLEDVHLAQGKNYVVAYDFPLGLLINFGGKSLDYKLLFNPKYQQESWISLNSEKYWFRQIKLSESKFTLALLEDI